MKNYKAWIAHFVLHVVMNKSSLKIYAMKFAFGHDSNSCRIHKGDKMMNELNSNKWIINN